jgi:hypothetical protein
MDGYMCVYVLMYVGLGKLGHTHLRLGRSSYTYMCLGHMLIHSLGLALVYMCEDATFRVSQAEGVSNTSNMVLYGNGVICTFYLLDVIFSLFDHLGQMLG